MPNNMDIGRKTTCNSQENEVVCERESGYYDEKGIEVRGTLAVVLFCVFLNNESLHKSFQIINQLIQLI